MLNMANLLGQLTNASNPTQMIMSTLDPQRKQMTAQFQNQSQEQQAQILATKCNELGINKQMLVQIMRVLYR